MKKILITLFVIPIVFAFSISHGEDAKKPIRIKPHYVKIKLPTDVIQHLLSINNLNIDTNSTLNDGDIDGIADDIDNCVDTVNPDQLDGDEDGKGDECDDVVNEKTNKNIVTDTNNSLADSGGDCSLNPSATVSVGWLVDMLLFSIPLAFIGNVKRKK